MAILVFRKDILRDSYLYKELMKYPCETIEDVLNKATSQIKWEEDENNQYSRVEWKLDRDSWPSRQADWPSFQTDRLDWRQRRVEPYQRNFSSLPIVDETHPNRIILEYNLCISPTTHAYLL